MPDWNPDKEAHRGHKWIVNKAFNKDGFNGVNVGAKDLSFNKEGRFTVKDEAMASAIRKKYPRTVTVSRVTDNHPSDRGHKYFFSCPAMPWHEED